MTTKSDHKDPMRTKPKPAKKATKTTKDRHDPRGEKPKPVKKNDKKTGVIGTRRTDGKPKPKPGPRRKRKPITKNQNKMM